MISRKTFVQNISLGAGALLLDPLSMLASDNIKTKVIILDAVAKFDFNKYFKKTFAIAEQYKFIQQSKLYTNGNIDSHSNCLNEITTDIDVRKSIQSMTSTRQLHFNHLLIEGFDVAHYNYNEYLISLSKCDEIISQIIAQEMRNAPTNILLMSSMGRNNFHNENAFDHELGGVDHHSIESRECFALEITNATLLTQAVSSNRMNTKELFQQFKTTKVTI
jgi:hypothetical protein